MPHIPEMIFFSLDFRSFKTCREVCKGWNELLKSDSYRKKLLSVFPAEGFIDKVNSERKLISASKEGDAWEVRHR